MQKLTSVLFLERPLAQYCDGELKGEHTDVASSLAAKKVEQKHLKVIIKEPYSYIKVLYPKYYKHMACTLAHQIRFVCSKMIHHGLNNGLFSLLHKFVCVKIHNELIDLKKFQIII